MADEVKAEIRLSAKKGAMSVAKDAKSTEVPGSSRYVAECVTLNQGEEVALPDNADADMGGGTVFIKNLSATYNPDTGSGGGEVVIRAKGAPGDEGATRDVISLPPGGVALFKRCGSVRYCLYCSSYPTEIEYLVTA